MRSEDVRVLRHSRGLNLDRLAMEECSTHCPLFEIQAESDIYSDS